MSAIISNDQVPEHLIGTREGLFHLLRGTSIDPEDDVFPRPALPRVARYKEALLRQTSSFYVKRFEKSEKDKIANLLRDDEFCFHR